MRSCSAFFSLRSALCASAAVEKASASAAAMLITLACMGTSCLRPSQQSRDQRDQEKDHKHYEQDLGDFRRAGCDAGEAKNRRDDGDDEKRKRPAQHDGLLNEWWVKLDEKRANRVPIEVAGRLPGPAGSM